MRTEPNVLSEPPNRDRTIQPERAMYANRTNTTERAMYADRTNTPERAKS